MRADGLRHAKSSRRIEFGGHDPRATREPPTTETRVTVNIGRGTVGANER